MLFCLGAPFSSLVKNLRKVDVSYVEILDEGLHRLNAKRLEAIREVAKEKSFELTLHAPFVDMNIASPNPVLRRTILKQLEKSIRYASRLDCRLLVFHPGKRTGISEFYPGLDWKLNLESMCHLLDVAKRYGVEISVENIPEPFPFLLKSVEDFSRFFAELGEDLGLTLDVGHANINHQTNDFMSKFRSRIIHVHASDNEGTSDTHRGIGQGTVEWRSVADSLKRTKYNRIIMLESIEHIEESIQTLQNLLT